MASLMAVSPLRARLAFRAARIYQDACVCRRSVHHQAKTPPQTQTQTRPPRDPPLVRRIQSHGPAQPRRHKPATSSKSTSTSPSASTPASTSTPLAALSESLSKSLFGKASPRPSPENALKAARSKLFRRWPNTSRKSVAYWLLGSAASVFGIVIFGGLTRLTESGLSITEWRPVTGSFPPLDQTAWEEEFERYKQSPEFKMLNSRMTLDEFKQIYWMEWIHRLWGRVVGVTFLLPTVYFIARRRVSPRMALRLVGICGLIGFQGFIGWWMVKSGLKDDLLEQGQHPRVSQYRLAAHLGTAFVAYLAMFWNGIRILQEHQLIRDPSKHVELLKTLQKPELRVFKRLVGALSVLVFITAMSGALVAGLDAGLIYNDFPWMGQGLLPPKSEMLDPFYSHKPSQSDIYWRNALENPVLVQLDHRILATTTFTAVVALWAYSRFGSKVRRALPQAAKSSMMGVLHMASIQVALGITTLWYLVPTPLASAHQAGALALLTTVFLLGSRVWMPKLAGNLIRPSLAKNNSIRHHGANSKLTTKSAKQALPKAKIIRYIAGDSKLTAKSQHNALPKNTATDSLRDRKR